MFITLKLEFKQTKEEKGLINYLDLTANRHTDHITIELYRKFTSTDTTIHYTSNHPMDTNSGLFIHLIYTVHTLPITDTNKNTWVPQHNKYS